ncbi:MAG: YqgE/AlgH family protein [Gammaproteobacteria bacterium]|nr:YqgE/AlgH family protein [Gammaproteobacteria bacterium]
MPSSNNNLTLKNHFLIAMPDLRDPNFSRSVTLICEHDQHGAIGLVVNRPTTITLSELFVQLKLKCIKPETANTQIMAGGPVCPENGFILHRPVGDWENTLGIADDMGLTTSIDILRSIADGNGPEQAIIALGYAGWGAGQLENELADNAWLTHPADSDMLFTTPREQLWDTAARAIGVDMSLLSHDAGHG